MRFLCLLLCLSVCSTALAVPPLPAEQWDGEAHLWLSRAAVAEANWVAERDHILIAWTLTYRWRNAVKRWPALKFVDVIRSYCAGLGFGSPSSPRQTWVRALPSVFEPWPSAVPSAYQRHWHNVQARMLKWGDGAFRDPSKGRVRNWGSPSVELPDRARAQIAIDDGRWVELDLGDTKNRYYGYAQN